jgi:hypothetical protein
MLEDQPCLPPSIIPCVPKHHMRERNMQLRIIYPKGLNPLLGPRFRLKTIQDQEP